MSDENNELESVENDSMEQELETAPENSQEELAEQKEMAKQLMKEFKLKVNGKDIIEKIDLNDEARIIKALQMEKAAQEAFQNQAALKKQQEEMQNSLAEFIEELRTNPLAVLQHQELGVDVRAIVEAYLQNEIERSQKSPEQLALEEAQAKLAELEEEKKQAQEEREAARRAQLEQEAAIQLENEIADVIEKGDLPKSKYISQKLTDLAYIAYSNGIDLSISEIAPLVKKQYLADMKDMLGISSDEIVEDLLGKDRIRSIRNKQIQALKSNTNATPKNALKTQDTGSGSIKEDAPTRMRAKDFFSKLSG
jgi:hypothetical protein